MKIIHTADFHLASSIDKSITKDKANELKLEIRNSFIKIIDYAKENNIKIILLAGDIFDKDIPSSKDEKFFIDNIKNNPDIDFLYLRGNHDPLYNNINLPNLKTFNDKWASYNYDNITISGIEMNEINAKTLSKTLNLAKDKINIVMLHAELTTENGLYKICLKDFKNKNINYLALGHIHKTEIGETEEFKYAYPGNLVGRSFDECGDKGFILLDIDKEIKVEFVSLNNRKIEDIDVDVSNLESDVEVYNKIKKLNLNKNNLYRFNLRGEVKDNVFFEPSEISSLLNNNFYFNVVLDKTSKAFDISKLSKDIGIKGEFIKLVKNDDTLTDEEKLKVINYGLIALREAKR